MKFFKKAVVGALCVAAVAFGMITAFGSDNAEASEPEPAHGVSIETPQLYLIFTPNDGEAKIVEAAQSSANWTTEDPDGDGFVFTSTQGINLWDIRATLLSDNIVLLTDVYGEIELYFEAEDGPDYVRVMRWTTTHVIDFQAEDGIYDGAEDIELHGNRFKVTNYNGHDYIYSVFATWGDNNVTYYFRTMGGPMPHNYTISEWAQNPVADAIALSLVPDNLQSDLTQAITRAEFSALAVRLYETTKGEIAGRITFVDTDDINVEKMGYLGVVFGVGDNRFDPDGTLTREQAAVMLSRLMGSFGMVFHDLIPPNFCDEDEISSWAGAAVKHMQLSGVMDGVGNNLFAPQSPYTREQSIITILRVFNAATATESHEPAASYVQPIPYEVGGVVIVANGTEHKPYEYFLHGGGVLDGMLYSVSGLRLPLEDILESETLTKIQHTDDFEIIIHGYDAMSVSFLLYDEDFNEIYSLEDSFMKPDGSGVFFLCVDVRWSNDETNTQFTLMRYVFKIVLS